jgi:hypothetical protein
VPVFLLAVLVFLGSCESLSLDYSRSQSWLTRGKPVLGTVAVRAVGIDRSGGWDSLEKEFAALAPLGFWEQGYLAVSEGREADYVAEIQAREREYSSGWRTRRSLAVEVRIWAAGEKGLPLAAGRVVAVGDRSFSSSHTIGRMLFRAIDRAVKKIPAREKGE